MEQLPAMQLAEDLQDAGDFAPDRGFGESTLAPLQKGAEVAVRRVLERQGIEQRAGRGRAAEQRKAVVDPDRARMAVEQMTEVRLAHPAVDAGADLDAHLVPG